jgi:hypothetical protein
MLKLLRDRLLEYLGKQESDVANLADRAEGGEFEGSWKRMEKQLKTSYSLLKYIVLGGKLPKRNILWALIKGKKF